MLEVIERATETVMQAERIEGGYQVFTMDGEKYKKLKDSTFKKYFKRTGNVPVKHQEVSAEKKVAMIEKIKKVLQLAQDNPSMEEGLAAALQAQKLMAKYNIHEDEVSLEEIKDEITSIFSHQKHNTHLMAWRKQLAVVVAENFRCKCYLMKKDIVFRGYKEDAQIALDVYLALYEIGNKLGSEAYSEQMKQTGSGKGAYNSFILGFLTGIRDGLGEQCTALMVIVPPEVEQEYTEFSAGFKADKGGLSVNSVDSNLYHKGYKEGKAAVKARAIETDK